MPIVFLVPTWSQALLLILVGLAGGGMMMLNTWAYKLLPPATVAAYEYTTLIWATIFGWIIWHEWPTLCVWQGTILILAGILLASTTKVKAPALK
jgi:drug/metabolite transporter (DMT)-like permease